LLTIFVDVPNLATAILH